VSPVHRKIVLEELKWPDRTRWQVPLQVVADDRYGLWAWSEPQTRDQGADYDAYLKLIPAYDWWVATWILNRGELIKLYIDVTTPAKWVTPDHVTMVDLEVDVHRLPDGTVEVLDEEEFAERSLEWQYPSLFVEVVPRVGQLLAARLIAGDEPFGTHGAGLIASLLN
jgi:hypothetical protein